MESMKKVTDRVSFYIRPASADELETLLEVERAAGQRFADLPAFAAVPDDITPMEELREAHRAGRVWVAAGPSQRCIGFAYASLVDGYCHLEELAVLPAFGRRGVGTALVQTVCAYAMSEQFAGVTLTTFREVPWNAPFYERLGFEVLEASSLTPGLAQAFADEARRGLPVHLRCVMHWRPSGEQP